MKEPYPGPSPVATALRNVGQAQLARVFTQLDRDPDSPTYGCFDRDHWHYKIRDFPSAILQQGVFLLEAVRRGDLIADLEPSIVTDWAVAAVNALGRAVDRAGGVNEYYPFERSYPASAFGLHAAVVVLRGWQDNAPELLDRIEWKPLRRLARRLSRRFEARAANQQGVGLAGLALALELPELRVDPERVREIADRFFALQHPEGWFEEYGGPDTGYLAVTLDALADYGDATLDPRAAEATERAVGFLAEVIGADGRIPGTLNSRNTDYLVPYGLTRAAATDATASWTLAQTFTDADSPNHFLAATDDRYHAHYIFASLIRALPHLDAITDPVEPVRSGESWLPGAGLWIHRDGSGDWSCAVSARKGGLVRVHRRDGAARVDHGWRLRRGRTLWTTSWWSDALEIEKEEGELVIRGRATRVRPLRSTPARHLALRCLAWFGRDRLIPLLKRALIFRRAGAGPQFERRVQVGGEGVEIIDRFESHPGTIATPAPRQNLRHVASADSFHPEDGHVGLLGNEPCPLEEGAEVKHCWAPVSRMRESYVG